MFHEIVEVYFYKQLVVMYLKLRFGNPKLGFPFHLPTQRLTFSFNNQCI